MRKVEPTGLCGWSGDATAYAQGRLSEPARAAFARHLASCAACRADVESARRVFARLAEVPASVPERDLAPAVLARVAGVIREERAAARRRRWAWRAAAGVAALFLAAAVGFFSLQRPPPTAGEDGAWAAMDEATSWLLAAQRADGGWHGVGGADRDYGPALTALALMAGLELGAEGKTEDACRRAADWLVRAQDDAGRFGRAFSGEPYNQGMAALALLNWCERHPDSTVRGPAERAVRRIVDTQTPAGGWGYAEGDPEPNVSVTVWQLQALGAAYRLGAAGDVEPALRRGLRWLRTNRNTDGLYGYRRTDDFPEGSEALTAMSVFCELACDASAAGREDVRRSLAQVVRKADENRDPSSYYAAFFTIRSLSAAGGADVKAVLDRFQTQMAARQERAGPDRGSWEPTDAYAAVGGRVYATVMASLSVQSY